MRSRAPRVLGILALVFAPLGVALAFVAYEIDNGGVPGYPSADRWLQVWFALVVAVFVVEVTAGVLALAGSRLAPTGMTVYALLAIGLRVADGLVFAETVRWGSDRWLETTMPHMVTAGVTIAWPIVVLVVMNTRRVKAAYLTA